MYFLFFFCKQWRPRPRRLGRSFSRNSHFVIDGKKSFFFFFLKDTFSVARVLIKKTGRGRQQYESAITGIYTFSECNCRKSIVCSLLWQRARCASAEASSYIEPRNLVILVCVNGKKTTQKQNRAGASGGRMRRRERKVIKGRKPPSDSPEQ